MKRLLKLSCKLSPSSLSFKLSLKLSLELSLKFSLKCKYVLWMDVQNLRGTAVKVSFAPGSAVPFLASEQAAASRRGMDDQTVIVVFHAETQRALKPLRVR